MKKIILLFSLLVTFLVTTDAQHVSTDKLMKTVSVVRSAQKDLDNRLDSLEARLDLNETIDTIQSLVAEGVPIVKKRVESKDDLTILLGFLLGAITFLLNNLVYKIKGVEEWVSKKFNKSAVTIALGVVATATAAIITYFTSELSWATVAVWLVSAWGTHFGAFVVGVQKPKAA